MRQEHLWHSGTERKWNQLGEYIKRVIKAEVYNPKSETLE